jgi:predicted RNase H-like nuclease
MFVTRSMVSTCLASSACRKLIRQQRTAQDEWVDEAQVVGVDAYRDGWVAAVVAVPVGDPVAGPVGGPGNRPISQVRWELYPRFETLLHAYPDAHVAVDIPLELPTSGRRPCEDEARAFLGSARSSIFYTPPWWTLTAYRLDGPHPRGVGVSIQTWNILPKVHEAMSARSATRHPRVGEVHPECSFRAMAGATKRNPGLVRTQLASKKTGLGVGQRLNLLRDRGAVSIPDLGGAPAGPAVDDLLDAVAAAWTAQRWRAGSADLIRFGSPASGQILA